MAISPDVFGNPANDPLWTESSLVDPSDAIVVRPRSPSQHSRQIKDATTPPPLSAESQVVFRTADLSCLPAEVASHARNVQDWDRVIVLSDRELASGQLACARPVGQSELPA